MKKLIALLITVLIIMSMPITAFAEELPPPSAAEQLIEVQKDTTNIAVYGEELSNNIGHIDGPIEVETLSDSTTINYNDGQGGESEQDSYVGETTESATVTTNDNVHGEEVLVVGEDVDVGEESGTANHTPKEVINEAAVEERNAAIEQTLEDIAKAGDAAIEEGLDAQITDYDTLVEEVKNVNEQLAETTEDDTLTLNIKGEVLSEGNNYDSLNKEISGLIYNNQNKSNIVINVDIPDNVENYIISTVEMNRNYDSYDLLAAYLYWNFGSFDKEITFQTEWGGIILAPAATVHLNAGIHSGRVVAKIVTSGGEIHTSVIEVPEHPNPPEPDNPPAPNPPEPEPEEPNIPNTPETPEMPGIKIPDNPVIIKQVVQKDRTVLDAERQLQKKQVVLDGARTRNAATGDDFPWQWLVTGLMGFLGLIGWIIRHINWGETDNQFFVFRKQKIFLEREKWWQYSFLKSKNFSSRKPTPTYVQAKHCVVSPP